MCTRFLVFVGLWMSLVSASARAEGRLVDGSSLLLVSPTEVASRLRAGDVLVLGELHDSQDHHDNQVAMLEAIASAQPTLPISVGMEFFERPYQGLVDQFLAGGLPEADFLKSIGWGGTPYELYRRQVAFPAAHQGFTLALNARRDLTAKIAKKGLESLTPEERSELPADFTLGNPGYLERFRQSMGGHVPDSAVERYFAAQSAWDETMADTATRFLRAHPEQLLVVIVGDFHAAYGGGLPDRLRARGAPEVVAISQVQATGLTDAELEELIRPDPRYGVRGRYVWIAP